MAIRILSRAGDYADQAAQASELPIGTAVRARHSQGVRRRACLSWVVCRSWRAAHELTFGLAFILAAGLLHAALRSGRSCRSRRPSVVLKVSRRGERMSLVSPCASHRHSRRGLRERHGSCCFQDRQHTVRRRLPGTHRVRVIAVNNRRSATDSASELQNSVCKIVIKLVSRNVTQTLNGSPSSACRM